MYPIVVDNLWLLRDSATNALEDMLANTRRQLSTLLANRQRNIFAFFVVRTFLVFVGLNEPDKMKECKRTIRACHSQISSIRDNWKEVSKFMSFLHCWFR